MLSFSRRLRRRRLTGTIQYADESRLLHIRHCGIGKHGDKPFYPLCMHVSSNADSTSVKIFHAGRNFPPLIDQGRRIRISIFDRLSRDCQGTDVQDSILCGH